LKKHGDRRDDDSTEHGAGFEQRPDSDELQLEHVPCRHLLEMWEVFRNGSLLEQRLGFDFEELQLDEFVVLGQAAEMSEGGAGFGLAVMVDQLARGEGHEDHANKKDECGEELEADGDQPGGG
jgi:hypothetical protein